MEVKTDDLISIYDNDIKKKTKNKKEYIILN